MCKRNPNVRKCNKCKEDIHIKQHEYIKDKVYFHIDCYIEKRRNRNISDKVIQEEIKIIKQQMLEEQKIKDQQELEKVKKKNSVFRDKILDEEFRKQFLDYIQEIYNINSLDKSFYIKLANINNGTFKDLKERISYEDLLYMFKTKQSYLDKLASDKVRKGQPFKDNKSRLNFDLAVIVNKYDNYKEWKEKQKLLEIEEKKEEVRLKKDKVDLNKIVKNNLNNNRTNSNYSIDDILNDIY